MRKPTGTRQHIRLLDHRRTSGLFLRDGEYIADIKPDEGGRTIRKIGTNRARAEAAFDALLVELEEAARSATDPFLISFLIETFLPTQKRLKSYAFSRDTVNAVVRFLNATEPKLRIGDIKPYHVERMRAFYSEHAPRSLNAYQQKLSQALNHAVDLGLIASNPIARVKPLTVDNRRTKFLTMDDFVRILDAAKNTDARDLFLVMALTGLRPSNVRLLTVAEVEGKTIRIPPSKMKNKRAGVIPISGFVADYLSERAAGKELDALLFPAKGTKNRPKSNRNLLRTFETVAERAGCAGFTTYDLRHFFASQLAKQGANEQQIGRLLCHVGQSVTSRYVHHDIEDLRRFVDALSLRYLDAAGDKSRAAIYRLEQDEPEADRITI